MEVRHAASRFRAHGWSDEGDPPILAHLRSDTAGNYRLRTLLAVNIGRCRGPMQVSMCRQIGSGPMESMCKATTQRIKDCGRRWDGEKAESVLALEAHAQRTAATLQPDPPTP